MIFMNMVQLHNHAYIASIDAKLIFFNHPFFINGTSLVSVLRNVNNTCENYFVNTNNNTLAFVVTSNNTAFEKCCQYLCPSFCDNTYTVLLFSNVHFYYGHLLITLME